MIIEHITSTYWKKQKGTYEKNENSKMEIPAEHSNVGISNELWGKQVKHRVKTFKAVCLCQWRSLHYTFF